MNIERDINDQPAGRYEWRPYTDKHEECPNADIWPVLNKRVSDVRILRHMARAISITLNLPDTRAEQGQPLIFAAQERRGRAHRIVIYHPREIASGRDLPFVGFISGRRQPIVPTISTEIELLDHQLVAQLASAPGVLSYSSLQLGGRNQLGPSGRNQLGPYWYNFALFSDTWAKTIFHRMDTHIYAAHKVAPRYYDWIRLHHGIIVGTLADGNLRLQYTRYITFDEQHVPAIRLINHQQEGAE